MQFMLRPFPKAFAAGRKIPEQSALPALLNRVVAQASAQPAQPDFPETAPEKVGESGRRLERLDRVAASLFRELDA